MGLFTAIAVIGLALSAVGLVTQTLANKKAQKQAKRQAAESNRLRKEAEKRQQRIADLQTLRAKRSAARVAQKAKADLLSNATARGAAAPGTTAVPGAAGSLTSKLTSQLTFLDRANQLNTQTVALLGQSQDIANKPIFTSQIGSAISSFGGTIFSNSEKIGGFFKKD